jgi:hypothetical protein
MPDADVSTLGALTAPHSAVGFLRDYWPDKPFVAHGDPARLPAFLRAPELASIEALVSPEAAAVFRWIADSRAAFSAGALAERFPMFPFTQHRQTLEAAARSGLIRLLWFPPLAAMASE